MQLGGQLPKQSTQLELVQETQLVQLPVQKVHSAVQKIQLAWQLQPDVPPKNTAEASNNAVATTAFFKN